MEWRRPDFPFIPDHAENRFRSNTYYNKLQDILTSHTLHLKQIQEKNKMYFSFLASLSLPHMVDHLENHIPHRVRWGNSPYNER